LYSNKKVKTPNLFVVINIVEGCVGRQRGM